MIGRLFAPETEDIDPKAFAERCQGDQHHFRFVVSPEDAVQLSDLKASPHSWPGKCSGQGVLVAFSSSGFNVIECQHTALNRGEQVYAGLRVRHGSARGRGDGGGYKEDPITDRLNTIGEEI